MDSKLQARVVATGAAGVMELMLFHPVDTVAKRLMNNQLELKGNFSSIIFQDKAQASALQKYGSLFPGIGYGALYKVSQRIYKFGGQPYVKEYAVKTLQPTTKTGKTLCDGFAGMLMGMGEVALLPLDVMKIKAQTNAEFRNMGVASIVRQEGLNLYAGWQWTMARNAPGSFALFGGNAIVKEFVFGLEDHRSATFFQTALSSAFGSICSILVACPLDVVKTRIQSGSYGDVGGIKIIQNIIKDEGAGAFFKGAVPKVSTVGPKLIFSFTVAQYLMSFLERKLVQ